MARFALALVFLAALSCATSPTGRRQLVLFSDDELAQMGAASFDQQKQDIPVASSSRENAYVRCIADAILAQVDPESVPSGPGPWEVLVFDSDQVNAFALPGRKIGVYRGMLKVAENQSQLAAVIGHEVGHVLARHGNERVSQATAAQLSQSAVSATLATQDMGSETGQLIMAGVGLGTQYGVLLPYSRTHESEADIIGLELMAKAGFDPRESVTLWQNMAAASGGQAPAELMSTHPSNDTRISNLRAHLPEAEATEKQARAQGRRPSC
jgi:predicted Zn-dependent protease